MSAAFDYVHIAVQPKAGVGLPQLIKRVARVANSLNCAVSFLYNGKAVVYTPGVSPKEFTKQYFISQSN